MICLNYIYYSIINYKMSLSYYNKSDRKKLHPKDIRKKHQMANNRHPSPENNDDTIPPYKDESKKLVNLPPRIERTQQTEINRQWYYPAQCNCCWSKKNQWYRRHHRVIKKKGDNKDNRKS